MSKQILAQRDIQATEPSQAAILSNPDLRLTFSHRGGFATLREAGSTVFRNEYRQVHGVLMDLSAKELQVLAKAETGYTLRKVLVQTYRGEHKEASAFFSKPSLLLKNEVPPTKRYLSLLQSGAAQQQLAKEYQDWLNSIKATVGGPLGPEYFETPSVIYANVALGVLVSFSLLVGLQMGR